MGRRPEQTFLQRKHTDDQEEHEKMFSSTDYWINTNKNSINKNLTPARMAIIKQSTKKTNAGEGVKRREPSSTVGGNVNWYSHYVKQYGGCK